MGEHGISIPSVGRNAYAKPVSEGRGMLRKILLV